MKSGITLTYIIRVPPLPPPKGVIGRIVGEIPGEKFVYFFRCLFDFFSREIGEICIGLERGKILGLLIDIYC